MVGDDDWKNATAGAPDTAGGAAEALPPHTRGRVLRPAEFSDRARYDFAWPAEGLLPWVERYWSVRWDLAPGESFRSDTLTEPALNLTYEYGGVARSGQTGAGFWVTGPGERRRFAVDLTGVGGVLGVKLRVGAGPGFGIADPGALMGQTAEAAAWFPDIARQWRAAGLVARSATGGTGTGGGEAATASQAKAELDTWLADRLPGPDAGYDRLRSVLAVMEDPRVTRLDQVAEGAGCSARTLERLFKAYVGIGPAWLLRRARVIDAVAALDAGSASATAPGTGPVEPLSDLAVRLGWFDQAHFTTDFRRVVGVTPQEYRGRSE